MPQKTFMGISRKEWEFKEWDEEDILNWCDYHDDGVPHYLKREDLVKVFDYLNEIGFIARENYMCCVGCATAALYSDTIRYYKKKGEIPYGAVYWHEQSEEAFYDRTESGIFIGYSAAFIDGEHLPYEAREVTYNYDKEEELYYRKFTSEEIGYLIVHFIELMTDLECDWNGDPDRQIHVRWGNEPYEYGERHDGKVFEFDEKKQQDVIKRFKNDKQ